MLCDLPGAGIGTCWPAAMRPGPVPAARDGSAALSTSTGMGALASLS
jgi:hypothetical protein